MTEERKAALAVSSLYEWILNAETDSKTLPVSVFFVTLPSRSSKENQRAALGKTVSKTTNTKL